MNRRHGRKDQSIRLAHALTALQEQTDEFGAAGQLALLVSLVDITGGLLSLTAHETGRTPEAMLDLMFLLAYEEDDERD